MVGVLNVAVGSLVDGLLSPFQSWPPLVGLTVVSLLVSLILLAVFKVTLDPRSVADVKRQIQAGLFELRLFRDDPQTVLRVGGELGRQQVLYLRRLLVPTLWMGVPLAFLVAQLQAHYGYDGLHPGQSALVKVRMAVSAGQTPSQRARPALALEAPEGLSVDTPGVWVPALGELAWRISARREGDYDLRISSADSVVTKHVRVSSLIVRRSAVRPAAGLWTELRYPAEAPLPVGQAIEAIEITYPERAIDVLGFSLHWLVIFVALSTVFTFLCRPVFRVVI